MSYVKTSSTSNKYCMPAALAALTDRHVDEIIQLLYQDFGDQQISGVYSGVALKLLQRLGYYWEQMNEWDGSIIHNLKYVHPKEKYLVCIHGHALVIINSLVVDNSFPTGIKIIEYPLRKKVINEVYKIWKHGE